ncbi:hypothetical protein F5Y13DRAFT_47406 [Hypoxylon sp. FL1857]|nr:hypothetical protein F5Y13DRAFT_47406 [Hypoxylon sp. FL1857]
MCIEIWNTFQLCNHKVYQNTFPCHVARRCAPDEDLLLERSKFLPDKPPKIPPGLLECKLRVATRPKNSKCQECIREERRAKMAGNENRSSVDLDSSTSRGKSVGSLETIHEQNEEESSIDLRTIQTEQPPPHPQTGKQ